MDFVKYKYTKKPMTDAHGGEYNYIDYGDGEGGEENAVGDAFAPGPVFTDIIPYGISTRQHLSTFGEDDDEEEEKQVEQQVEESKCKPHQRRSNSVFWREWAPSILPRSLVMGLGYTVGSNAYNSTAGLRTMVFVMLAFLINEFAFALVKKSHAWSRFSARRQPSGRATLSERLFRSAERLTVLIRLFTLMTITYAANETMKKLFYGVDDIITIVFGFTIVFVMSEMTQDLYIPMYEEASASMSPKSDNKDDNKNIHY
jgi:hypothetical protein